MTKGPSQHKDSALHTRAMATAYLVFKWWMKKASARQAAGGWLKEAQGGAPMLHGPMLLARLSIAAPMCGTASSMGPRSMGATHMAPTLRRPQPCRRCWTWTL